MIGHLSHRERMIIIVSLIVAVVIGGWEFLARPVLDRNDATAELLPTRERLLQRRQDLVARRGAVQNELDTVGAKIDALSGRLLTAATPPVAASELQKIAKDFASAATTEVRSERILPPVERGELLEIPVEIAVSGEIRNLVDFLARLEGAPKLMAVQELKVRVMNIAQPKELLATITLSGFILPNKTKA
jgi:Tfp pilus assembly protein PilO